MSSSPSSLKRKHRQSTEEVDQTQSFESEFADDDDGWNDSDSTEDWDMTLLKRTPTAVIRLPISTTDFESGQDADVTLTGSPLSAPFSSNPSKSTSKTESTSSSIQHQVLNRIPPKASPLEESSRNRSSSSVYVPSLIRPNTASKRLKLSILPKEEVLKLPPMAGLLKRIELFQFMCHEWLVFDFSPNINFIVGGKSAILTALIVCLGGSAKLTDRANAMDRLIMTDKSAAEIKLLIHNKGPDAFRPEVYGDTIIIKRKIVQAGAGSGSYVVQDSCEKVVATKRDEIDAICDYFNVNVTNPLSVLTQDRARNFLTGSSPEHMYKVRHCKLFYDSKDMVIRRDAVDLDFESAAFISKLPCYSHNSQQSRGPLKTMFTELRNPSTIPMDSVKRRTQNLVLQQLVIFCKIEKRCLVATKHEGDRLLSSNEFVLPPGVEIHTKDNAIIGGRGGGLQTRAGAERLQGTPVLATDVRREIRNQEEAASEVRREIRRQKATLDELEESISELSGSKDSFTKQERRHNCQVDELSLEIESLEDNLKENESGSVGIYEEQKKKLNDDLRIYSAQLETLQNLKADQKEKLQDCRNEIAAENK
ncbi:Structural maintenance of chromosomes protein 6 [Chytriomyces hyalinus]|nr:Structural maintenance of chromosomes protein 6 [Chytriomyces hyalinus]